jgi:hypothetical protein
MRQNKTEYLLIYKVYKKVYRSCGFCKCLHCSLILKERDSF